MKKILLLLLVMMTTGCFTEYLDEPFYNIKSETTYSKSMKDNAFVGIPTMAADLFGCALTAPFLPIYFPLKEKYRDDEDAYNSLNTTFSVVPRLTGKIVGYPLKIIKYIFYDAWYYP